jgi:hypothetical protein
METKPFTMQSPEQIAKDYSGNKQKIAEAMQMGILDPTAGTLAGMFIDRMRSAATQEGAPQQTVAQQTFAPPAPPAPPAGLGATPQAAAMPPMNATPPMGATPPQGAPPQEMSPPPQGMPPQGMSPPPQGMPAMAEGGMVPPYASGGGLSALPVPDGMFDEPTNGGFDDGYAGGGLVAFAMGNEVEEEDETYSSPAELAAEQQTGAIVASGEKAPKLNTSYLPGMAFKPPGNILANFKQNVLGSSDLADELSPRATKRAQQLESLLEEEMSPETQKARAKEDMDMAMIKAGIAMANTPGSLLQSATAGAGAALPGFEAAAKERRGAKRALTKELLSEERLSNKELSDRFAMSLDMVVKGIIPLEEAFQDRNFRDRWAKMNSADQRYVADSNARAGIITTGMSVAGQKDVAGKQLEGQRIGAANAVGDYVDKLLTLDGDYQGLLATNPAEASLYRSNLIRQNLDRQFGGSDDPFGFRR